MHNGYLHTFKPYQEEPLSGIRHMRRIPHSSRGLGRGRRSTSNSGPFQSNFSTLTAAAREASNFDPIAGSLFDDFIWTL